MSIAKNYATRISQQLPLVKSGTLRIWGEWFGRPYDNIHRITEASADGSKLILSFDQGETLTICDPERATLDARTFQIVDATRVRWEWYDYGRRRSPANLYFLDYRLEPEGWTVSTNWRFRQTPGQPSGGPAVELV